MVASPGAGGAGRAGEVGWGVRAETGTRLHGPAGREKVPASAWAGAGLIRTYSSYSSEQPTICSSPYTHSSSSSSSSSSASASTSSSIDRQ